MRLIHIDDGDALNIDCVVVNKVDSKDCKCFYSCDLIDQYEARLKSDKLAMLKEIKSEVEEREADSVIHARWLLPDRNYSTMIWRKCSNCNIHIEKFSKYNSFMGGVNYFENKYDYCPYCGAKMDLKENQNES